MDAAKTFAAKMRMYHFTSFSKETIRCAVNSMSHALVAYLKGKSVSRRVKPIVKVTLRAAEGILGWGEDDVLRNCLCFSRGTTASVVKSKGRPSIAYGVSKAFKKMVVDLLDCLYLLLKESRGIGCETISDLRKFDPLLCDYIGRLSALLLGLEDLKDTVALEVLEERVKDMLVSRRKIEDILVREGGSR